MTAFHEKRRIHFVSFHFYTTNALFFIFYIDKKEGNGYNTCIMGRGYCAYLLPNRYFSFHNNIEHVDERKD